MGDTAKAEIDGADKALLDMAEVASSFGWDVPYPEKINDDDLTSLVFLLSITRGLPLPIDSVTATIRKSAETSELIRQYANSQLEIIAYFESIASPLIFCGTDVTTGPIMFHSLEARIANLSDLLRRLSDAAEGEDIAIQFTVGVIHAQRATQDVRHLYVRPVVPVDEASPGTK